MSSVQAVILAGGEGNRLRPLTKNRPQSLLPVANKPILERVLDSVVASGIRDITVVVGYKKEKVMKLLNSYEVPVNVVIQPKQLGSAHALAAAKSAIHTDTLILPAGNFIGVETIQLLLKTKNAILASPHTNPRNFGVISQKDGLLCGIVEKPSYADETEAASCGVYYFTKELLSSVDIGSVKEMPDLLNLFVLRGDEIHVVMTKSWQDMLGPADLLGANRYYLNKTSSRLGGKIDSGAKIFGHVSIGRDSVIGPGVVITGPVIIGKNCEILANVCIGPNTSVADRVTIEPFCYLKDSIVMRDCVIESGSRICGAVLGSGCLVGNNTSTQGSVVLGDLAEIGPHTVLKDCIAGNNAVADGNKILSGVIPDDARVI
ncbi:MAG TPA: sugar phosphate nucleotidyltransferase [Methanocorpusculum sp.]|nr:sugar phosphate nucleotidyltransferase [Methanocorpusculum sp.]